MRILWVEDLGDNDCPAPDLSEVYTWERKSTYSKAKDAIKNHLDKYDVVLLDINLTGAETSSDSIGEHYRKDVPAKTDSPFNLEKDKFLREAGFHLYIQLLEMGFPKDRIAFLSANISNENEVGEGNQPKPTFNDFKNRFNAARIEAPIAFEKNKPDTNTTMESNPFNTGEEKSELAKWLDGCETDYIKLRRGIIDASDSLTSNSSTECLNSELSKSEYFGNDIKDKLAELRAMVPMVEPEDESKNRLLKRMARAIVHDWESYYALKATFGWLLRTTRNWLAHEKGTLSIKVEEKDIAFFFILHIRSVFKTLPESYAAIENKLLSLFDSAETLDLSAVDWGVKKSYYTMYTMTEHIRQLKCRDCRIKDSLQFLELISNCRKHLEHNHKFNSKHEAGKNGSLCNECPCGRKWLEGGMLLLYQGFFHTICYPKSNRFQFFEPEKRGQLTCKMGFKEFDPTHKKLAIYFFNYAEFPEYRSSNGK